MPRKALGKYYDDWRDELERFLTRRLSSPDLAAELTQEAFIRLMRVDPPSLVRDPRAWLFRTASNLVVDHHRTTRRAPFDAIEDAVRENIADPTPTQEMAALSREELAVVHKAIEDLPPRGREVFKLSRFEGLGYSEIAERLGISRNTVVVHMVRSLAACKQRLNAYREGDEGPE
ncbi:RNA polymerase sigma factor [Sphingobium cloacae]|uniref:RNA polymerase sigma factor, sigma-70 family n=1 Tax=Sphingobium cloacae TaxID=120107 RepID=A0A1E1F0R1_9SPHN|nr:RNA polymerase sigma factor [Sphingobium cloacae]BAV64087.1 RNA polymerase sigma factor, sigma-70 family [Sphingobium cloacae]